MSRFATASIVAVAAASVVGFAGSSFAAAPPVTISVQTSLAPNAFGSPSYAGYISNTIYALENGLSSYGSGPTAFAPVTGPISRASAIVTGFNSWLGDANPTATYGPAYGSELGNRLSFPLDVKGNGTKVSISELSLTGVSTGDANGLGAGVAHAEGSYNYGTDYVGINYGPNGVQGGGDDSFVTSGLNTQLVDEIVGRGSGVSYAAYTDPLLTNQQAIDAAANDPAAQWDTFTGTYALDLGVGNTVTGSAEFTATPEPGSLALVGVAGLGLMMRRRRRAM